MMMTFLTRYIGRQLLFTTLSVITVLTCVVWLAQSLRFVDLVASKGVTIQLFLQMIFLLLPNLVIIVIPIALLTAIVFIYNKLITDHELIVMQSSGFSYWKIAKPGLLVAAFFTIIMYVFTLYVMPVSSGHFRDIEHSLKQTKNINILQPGQFKNVGRYTVYLRKKLPNNEVKGALIYDFHDLAKPVTHMAEHGVIIEGADSSRLILFDGSTQEKDPKTGKPKILYFDQYTFETEKGRKEKKRKIKHQELFLWDLLFPSAEILENYIRAKESTRFRVIAEGHQRLISPLYCMVFAILGLCALILFPYSRRGRVHHIVGATILACVFYVIALVLLNMQKNIVLTISLLYGFVIGVILLGLYLLSDLRLFSKKVKGEGV